MNRPGRPPLFAALLLAGALAVGVWAWEAGTHRHGSSHRSHGRRTRSPVAVAGATPAPSTRSSLDSPAESSTPAPTATPDAAAARERLAVVIKAVAAQSDPAKLSTLGPRGANPRLKKIVFYLAEGRDAGADPVAIIRAAQRANGSANAPRAALVEAGLLRNLKITDGLGLLTPDNRHRLKRGAAPIVTRGPYTGQPAEVDHIVPLALAPELDHELANLELMPERLNRQKSDRVGERQLDYAFRFQAAGLLRAGTFERVQGAFRPAEPASTKLAVPVSASKPACPKPLGPGTLAGQVGA